MLLALACLLASPAAVNANGAAAGPAPAKRVISLYGAFNEILLALDAGDMLVGRTNADRDIPGLASLPAIGTHMRPNTELVAAAKPDLVLQMSGRSEVALGVESLRRLGLNVAVFPLDSFGDLFAATLEIGSLIGREKEAAALVADWRRRLATLKHKHEKDAQKPKVFFEVRYPNLLGAGHGGIVNEIIEAAGGTNVVEVPKKLAPISEEALLLVNPDFYLLQKGPMNPAPEPVENREHFRLLNAVKNGKILEVDEKKFSRPGPRSVEAAEKLEKWLFAGENRE